MKECGWTVSKWYKGWLKKKSLLLACHSESASCDCCFAAVRPQSQAISLIGSSGSSTDRHWLQKFTVDCAILVCLVTNTILQLCCLLLHAHVLPVPVPSSPIDPREEQEWAHSPASTNHYHWCLQISITKSSNNKNTFLFTQYLVEWVFFVVIWIGQIVERFRISKMSNFLCLAGQFTDSLTLFH